VDSSFTPASLHNTENRPAPIPTAYHQAMRFFEALATAFFRTFGITQPSDQTRRRAAWFLFGLLALILVAIGTATSIVFHIM
jgi:hypothetical protein